MHKQLLLDLEKQIFSEEMKLGLGGGDDKFGEQFHSAHANSEDERD